jgi:quinol monooxygenase YgiN
MPNGPAIVEVSVIIVAGYFVVDPGQRAAFLDSRAEGMRASRAEPGCITYAFSPDPLEPGRVLLFERWESKEALGAHLAGLRARPRTPDGIEVLESELQQYEISAVGPVGS